LRGTASGTVGTIAFVFALTCGWVVACHDDDAGSLPPKAPTVPNTPLVPVPVPGTTAEASPEPDDEEPPSALTVAVDVDPAVSADEWRINVTFLDDAIGDRTLTFTDRQAELTVQPSVDMAGRVRIEIYGTTKLSNGSDYIVGHRVVTTRFVAHQHRLVYLFVDDQCAYRGGTRDGGSGCASEEEWCYEGRCRTEEILGDPLPFYRSSWKEHPPSPCPGSVPEVHLGEGFTTYAERLDGDTVTIECGPQGGHHIWIAARTQGLDQRGPIITVTSPASDAGAPLITSYPVARLYGSDDTLAETYCEVKGVQFQLDPDGRPVQAYLGKPLDITLAIQDKNGQRAQVTRHLQVAPKLSTTSCFPP
jgi:hypothetical protein